MIVAPAAVCKPGFAADDVHTGRLVVFRNIAAGHSIAAEPAAGLHKLSAHRPRNFKVLL